MQEARDEVFCHFIARRAVARAALHLGLESMTQEALDVVAAILLEYLSRIGQTVAYSVEASGRSSAHIHVLDAIRAVELCTTTAVHKVHAHDGTGGPDGPASSSVVGNTPLLDAAYQQSWKGLAAFLFGPDWHVPQREKKKISFLDSNSNTPEPGVGVAEEEDGAGGAVPGGGKVGPLSGNGEANVSTAPVLASAAANAAATPILLKGNNTSSGNKGWDAPYPEEIPDFPTASSNVANPHPLSNSAAVESLHTIILEPARPTAEDVKNAGKAAEDEAALLQSQVPESVFTVWGDWDKSATNGKNAVAMETGDGNAKRRREDETADHPAAKKARISFAADASKKGANNDNSAGNENAFFPIFYPQLPRMSNGLRTAVLDMSDEAFEGTSGHDQKPLGKPSSGSSQRTSTSHPSCKTIRSSLVQLVHQNYWGTGWDQEEDDPLDDNNNNVKSNPKKANVGVLIVPPGMDPAPQVELPIAPLTKASNSRVSQILEGSIEAAAMT